MTQKTASEYAKEYDRMICSIIEGDETDTRTLPDIIQAAMDAATEAERERCIAIIEGLPRPTGPLGDSFQCAQWNAMAAIRNGEDRE